MKPQPKPVVLDKPIPAPPLEGKPKPLPLEKPIPKPPLEQPGKKEIRL